MRSTRFSTSSRMPGETVAWAGISLQTRQPPTLLGVGDTLLRAFVDALALPQRLVVEAPAELHLLQEDGLLRLRGVEAVAVATPQRDSLSPALAHPLYESLLDGTLVLLDHLGVRLSFLLVPSPRPSAGFVSWCGPRLHRYEPNVDLSGRWRDKAKPRNRPGLQRARDAAWVRGRSLDAPIASALTTSHAPVLRKPFLAQRRIVSVVRKSFRGTLRGRMGSRVSLDRCDWLREGR